MDGEAAELPDPLREWVQQQAAETGRTPSEVLARAAAAYRLLEDDRDDLPGPQALLTSELDRADPEAIGTALDEETVRAAIDEETLLAALDEGTLEPLIERAVADQLSELDRQTTALTDRVAALETELDEKIDDVRSRVIQVKRETDAKAPADHEHPELSDDLAAIDERADELAATTAATEESIAELRETIAETRRRLDGGFDNYEEVLRRLKDATEELREQTETLGGAVSRQRDRIVTLEAAHGRRNDVEALQRQAVQKGVTDASCESCGTTVHLGLLGAARCPHCDAPYEGIDTDTGLFRGPKITVADRPALESPDGTTDTEDAS